MRFFIMVFLSLFFIQTTVLCETYYVAPGGNDLGPGSFDEPWETIAKATSTITAGDTAFIREGTYYEGASFKNSGTAEEKIVLMAYENENVVMDGSSKFDTLIYVPGDYIEIYDIKLRNGRSWGILLVFASNIKIQNCDIQDIVHSGIRTLVSSNIEIIDNTINNAAEVTIWASGIRSSYDSNLRITGNNVTNIPSAGGISVDHAEYVTVEDNYTYNTVGPGIGIYESNEVEVNDNEVVLACNDGAGECISIASCHDFEIFNNEIHTSGIVDWGAEGLTTKGNSSNGKVYNNYVHDLDKTAIYICVDTTTSTGIEVFSNVVDNCQIGIALGSEVSGVLEDISVYRNIVTRSFGHGINVACWVEDGLRKDIYIYNNTLYKNGTNENYYRGGICVESSNVENIHILNNICSQNTQFQIGIMDSAVSEEVIIEYNLIDGTQTHETAVYGENYILDSPEFVDTSNTDLHLTENSPAIDKGHPDPQYNDPDGTRNDIGAYYYPQSGVVIPDTFAFVLNYPNVFGPSTEISYRIQKANFINLKIYDPLGREIKTLVNEFQEANTYSYNVTHLVSGIYYLKLQVGNDFAVTKKIVLIR